MSINDDDLDRIAKSMHEHGVPRHTQELVAKKIAELADRIERAEAAAAKLAEPVTADGVYKSLQAGVTAEALHKRAARGVAAGSLDRDDVWSMMNALFQKQFNDGQLGDDFDISHGEWLEGPEGRRWVELYGEASAPAPAPTNVDKRAAEAAADPITKAAMAEFPDADEPDAVAAYLATDAGQAHWERTSS